MQSRRMAFFGTVVNLSEYGEVEHFSANEVILSSADGKIIQVRDKIKYIKNLIIEGSHHPDVVQLAREIVHNVPDKDHRGEIKAVWSWMRKNFRYVRDPLGQEVIIPAPKQVEHYREGKLRGDCDEFTVFAGAILQAIGHPVRIVLWRKPSGSWQHIFIIAYAGNKKKWFAVDATEKTKPFGWISPTGVFKVIKLPGDSAPDEKMFGNIFKSIGNFFTKAWKGVKKVATNVWTGIKKVLPIAAGALSAAIPGVGPLIAPLAVSLTSGLVNKGGKASSVDPQKIIDSVSSGKSPLEALKESGVASEVLNPVLKTVQSLAPQLQNFAQNQMPGLLKTVNAVTGGVIPKEYLEQAQQLAMRGGQMLTQAAPAIASIATNTYAQRNGYATSPDMYLPVFQQMAQQQFSPQYQQQYPQQQFYPQQFYPQQIQQFPQQFDPQMQQMQMQPQVDPAVMQQYMQQMFAQQQMQPQQYQQQQYQQQYPQEYYQQQAQQGVQTLSKAAKAALKKQQKAFLKQQKLQQAQQMPAQQSALQGLATIKNALRT